MLYETVDDFMDLKLKKKTCGRYVETNLSDQSDLHCGIKYNKQ